MIMEKEEIWKEVEGYQDYYVSNLGRVKSTKFGKERILKSHKNHDGYMCVGLSFNSKVKTYKVHRLVAKAFIPNPAGLPCINHKDEIKTDNHVENLEWCSVQYNNLYGTAIQRMKATQIKRGILRPIRQLTLEGEVIATYPSISEAVRSSGMSLGRIMGYLRGTIKNPRKYKWEYIL